MSVEPVPPVPNDLTNDERWLLIERVVATGPFQKSARLRELLRYLADRSIHGHSAELTEHHIGSAIFGKPMDYSPVEDSSVRVQVRQLRLKLHEYFDGEGRDEPLIVEIPKGAYIPVFRHARSSIAAPAGIPVLLPGKAAGGPRLRSARFAWISFVSASWILTAALAVVCALLWHRLAATPTALTPPPWPLSQVFSKTEETDLVVADVNYGMLRIIDEKAGSLEQYLSPGFSQSFTPPNMSGRETRLFNYISNSLLTSYADVVVVNALSSVLSASGGRVLVRSAKDLRLRDLQAGNYILVGSPGSNPWVSLFNSKLNFIESEGIVGQSAKFFENKHPRPGEQKTYQDLELSGSRGEDYATIALLPIDNGNGKVLILQGLHEEGTEAAGRFLADRANRQLLEKTLGIQSSANSTYFEALLRTQAVAGAPNDTMIVATRVIH